MTSSSLLVRIKSRDADAWQRFAKVYGPLVYHWARETGLQDSDAADVMQEVFHSVAKGIETFRHGRAGDSFRGWLWTITRNKIRDYFRKTAKEPEAQGGSAARDQIQHVPEQPPPESGDTGSSTITNPARRTLDLIRNEFKPKTWEAFWRVTVAGDKPADVAQDLGMSVTSVYTAKSRIFRRIREEMEGLLD